MLSIIRLRLIKLKDEYYVILLMTLMAFGFTYIFGLASSGDYTPRTIIVDEDNTKYSQMMINELSKVDAFNYDVLIREDAIDDVKEGRAIGAVIIKKGFQESIIKEDRAKLGLVKIKDDRDILTLENIVSSIAGKMIGNIKISNITADYIIKNSDKNRKDVFNKAYNKSIDHWEHRLPFDINKKTYNSSNNFDNLKHGIIGFSLFFSMYTIVFSIGEILNERKYNTWQRLLISPISKTSLLGGNFIVAFVIGVFQIGVLILGGKYLFGTDLGSSSIGLLLIAFAFVFAVTSLGLLLSGVVKTHSQLSAITPVILTSTSMLGGTMWPLEIVNSKILLLLANFTPQRWAISGMEKIAMYGGGFNTAIKPTLVLIVMGILFFGIGVRLVKFQ